MAGVPAEEAFEETIGVALARVGMADGEHRCPEPDRLGGGDERGCARGLGDLEDGEVVLGFVATTSASTLRPSRKTTLISRPMAMT